MQQSKLCSKETVAVASVIMGIISITGTWLWIFLPYSWKIFFLAPIPNIIIYHTFFILLSLIGLGVGIFSLRSKRKILIIVSIAGILLSLIGLLLLISSLLLHLGIISTVA